MPLALLAQVTRSLPIARRCRLVLRHGRALSRLFVRSALALGVAIAGSADAAPANDSFAQRATLPGTNGAAYGSLQGATPEAGEPSFLGISSGQTAWWTWVAPSNGSLALHAAATGFAPLMAVYAGSDLANLSLVATNQYLACHPSCGCHWRVRSAPLQFHVARGQSYHISVDSAVITDPYLTWFFTTNQTPVGPIVSAYWGSVTTTNIPSGGDLRLLWQLTPAPKNDDFERRRRLAGTRLRWRASNAGATSQAGEPMHCSQPGGSSVWFTWTAPASGRVTLSTNPPPIYRLLHTVDGAVNTVSFSGNITSPGRLICGPLVDQDPPPVFSPLLAAYTGTNVNELTPAECTVLTFPNRSTGIAFNVRRGTTYQIAFDGYRGTTGEVPLWLALTQPAANDHFERRIRLTGRSGYAIGYNVGATAQPGEPDPTQSVWWSWIPPVSGIASISLVGSDYPFPVFIYRGSRLATLELVAAGLGEVDFETRAGVAYQIAVGDSEGRTGQIILRLNRPGTGGGPGSQGPLSP